MSDVAPTSMEKVSGAVLDSFIDEYQPGCEMHRMLVELREWRRACTGKHGSQASCVSSPAAPAPTSKKRLFKSLDGKSKADHLRDLANEVRLSAGILNECATLFDDVDAFLGALAECFDETEEEFSDIRDMRGRIRGELVAPSRAAPAAPAPASQPPADEPRAVCACGHAYAPMHQTPGTECSVEDCPCACYRAAQPPSDDAKEIERLRWAVRRLRDQCDTNGDRQGVSIATVALLPTLTASQPPRVATIGHVVGNDKLTLTAAMLSMNTSEPPVSKLVECRSQIGELRAIEMDRSNRTYGWVYYKHTGGEWVTLRKATAQEMESAQILLDGTASAPTLRSS